MQRALSHLLGFFRVSGLGLCSYGMGFESSYLGASLAGLPAEFGVELLERGFRHSGAYWYRPQCVVCKQCLPLRIEVPKFCLSKRQRRVWQKNADLRYYLAPLELNKEKCKMYEDYLHFQHPETHQSGEDLEAFLYEPHEFAYELRFESGARLVAISIVDYFPGRGFSSVYHFFDPAYAKRSLGVFSVLAELDFCRSQGVPYYYLGYWLPHCAKMSYKGDYGPNEIYWEGQWLEHDVAMAKMGIEQAAGTIDRV